MFLTGTEIDATDIRHSILRKVFPDSEQHTFEEFLQELRLSCYQNNKFFVLLIDGINENTNTKLLSSKLESFCEELLEHDFVKIVLSCRTEYYHQNFKNLEKSSFAQEIRQITSLLGDRQDDKVKEKLFSIYFDHFDIKYNSISKKAYSQLVENFLLLRIFCETYQTGRFNSIDDIYKVELFEKYYADKCEEISRKLTENDEFNIKGKIDIRKFIERVVDTMIRARMYANVPFEAIFEDSKDRELYIRFLDENILVRRDMQTDEKGLFTTSEVINFTFDEFRDFMVSRYLVEVLYQKSQNEFSQFLEFEFTEKSPILEGCSTFLFFISRKRSDTSLDAIISSQPWFEKTFSKCIFNVKDSQVSDSDKSKVGVILRSGIDSSNSIIFNLIVRRDSSTYKNLNIDFLFITLRDLDQESYEKCFVNKFGTGGWESQFKINQEDVVDQIGAIFAGGDLDDDASFHKLFELLIYMFLNRENWKITTLYEKYYYKYNEIGKRQLKSALESKAKSLTDMIQQFLEEYEISL